MELTPGMKVRTKYANSPEAIVLAVDGDVVWVRLTAHDHRTWLIAEVEPAPEPNPWEVLRDAARELVRAADAVGGATERIWSNLRAAQSDVRWALEAVANLPVPQEWFEAAQALIESCGPGHCPSCDEPIEVGDPVARIVDGPVVHEGCAK
jgi:hypothetical protein